MTSCLDSTDSLHPHLAYAINIRFNVAWERLANHSIFLPHGRRLVCE